MKKITRIIKCSSTILFALVGCATVCLSGAYLYLAPQLPEVKTLREVKLQTPLRIYSEDKKLIAEYGEKRRTPISYVDAPPLFFKAILSAEDDRFYSHHGVDIKGLLRAALQLIQTGHIQTGGSTITMQVAKNFFLSHERTFHRKFTEILLALQIERELSKEEILELYINKIYLGHRAYGIQAASKVYYGTSIDNLSLAQLAMIAGLPKAPSSYNPITNPTRALTRRNWILKRMLHLNHIDIEAYDAAIEEPVTARYHGQKPQIKAPYAAEMVRKKLLKKQGSLIYTGGYNVYTTIKSELQESANQAVVNGLISYDKRHGYRGPEQKLSQENEITSFEDIPLEWHQALAQASIIHHLKPAIVLKANDENATILLANQEVSTLSLTALEWAKPYLTVNSVGKTPKKCSDILKTGYLIRVYFDEKKGHWALGQIPDVQGALVSINPKDGATQALVGGFNFHSSKYNRAAQAARQPGSNIKPFIYATALENGFTAATLINDAPVVFDDAQLENTWRPENSSGRFFGPTRLRQALYKSRNLVSIRILKAVTIPTAIDALDKYGFDREKLPKDLSLALGSAAFSPLEIASGYTAFANGGYRVNNYLISKVEDRDGNIIFETLPDYICPECLELPTEAEETENELTQDESKKHTELTELIEATSAVKETEDESSIATQAQPQPAQRVVSERANYILNSMLRDVILKGTARKARVLNRSDLAGKTGTTNNQVDAWFSGFSQDLVTTTWVGFDKPATLGRREYGGTAALPIWIEYMGKALKDKPEHNLVQPNGLVTVRIDPITGLKAKANQKDAIFELFRIENAPTDKAPDNAEVTPDSLTEADTPDEELF